jgi:hypothetical protein
MSIQTSRSLRPLLIGSLVALSVACRSDADRSNAVDTTTTPSDTARSTPTSPTPGTMPSQRPSSAELNRDDRMPVTGRDDMRDDSIGLGTGGSTGMGGSGGSGGSHH